MLLTRRRRLEWLRSDTVSGRIGLGELGFSFLSQSIKEEAGVHMHVLAMGSERTRSDRERERERPYERESYGRVFFKEIVKYIERAMT